MRRYALIASLLVILPIVGLVAWQHYLDHARSHRSLTVSYQDANSVELWRGDQLITPVKASGDKVEVRRMASDYTVKYRGDERFADGEVVVGIDVSEITIEPAFSSSVLADIYRDEQASIESVIYEEYPDIEALYDITNDRLYQRGEWYGATLTYSGDSLFNRDNLGIILQKTDGKWQLITKPPMPSVNIYTYPDTPINLLQSVNDALFSDN